MIHRCALIGQFLAVQNKDQLESLLKSGLAHDAKQLGEDLEAHSTTAIVIQQLQVHMYMYQSCRHVTYLHINN